VLDAKIHWDFIALRFNGSAGKRKGNSGFAEWGRASPDTFLALELRPL
jgi:hypothetical protein